MYYVTAEGNGHKVINDNGRTIRKFKGINSGKKAQEKRYNLNEKQRLSSD